MNPFFAPSRRVIAIIEEQQAMVELLQHELTAAGYEVVAVPEPFALRQAMRGCHFDLVLLDVAMTSSDGWRMLAALRDDPLTEAIPVVIASAIWDRAGLRFLPVGGPIRFTRKPFDIAELIALLDRMLLAPPAEQESHQTTAAISL